MLETKVPNMAWGESAPDTMMLINDRGAVIPVRSVNAPLFSFVRGLGPGTRLTAMARSDKNVARTPVTRVIRVGVRFRSVGQRFKFQFAERWVLW